MVNKKNKNKIGVNILIVLKNNESISNDVKIKYLNLLL